MCLIAGDLSQSAGYELLQWSFNLSVCLIASDLSRYALYELFQWSYSVCLICPDPLCRAWLRANCTTCNNPLLRNSTCERIKDSGSTSARRFQPRGFYKPVSCFIWRACSAS